MFNLLPHLGKKVTVVNKAEEVCSEGQGFDASCTHRLCELLDDD